MIEQPTEIYKAITRVRFTGVRPPRRYWPHPSDWVDLMEWANVTGRRIRKAGDPIIYPHPVPQNMTRTRPNRYLR